MLSIVIPTYNEASEIKETIHALQKHLAGKEYELIVSDDGSSDATVTLVKELGIKVLENRHLGKGAAVKAGMLAATGDKIVFMDADLSTPLTELAALLISLDRGADIAIGSRAKKGAAITLHQPWWREGIGRLFNLFIQILILPGIADTQCGFKAFKRDAAKKLVSLQKLDGFIFDVEILYLARKQNYKIDEIPVMWHNSNDSRVNVLRELLSVIFDVLRIRIIHK
ncbi:dolichyl-phosphate beta-glucosyltransferase [Candidatus Margulisiibacteriota bacterium]